MSHSPGVPSGGNGIARLIAALRRPAEADELADALWLAQHLPEGAAVRGSPPAEPKPAPVVVPPRDGEPAGEPEPVVPAAARHRAVTAGPGSPELYLPPGDDAGPAAALPAARVPAVAALPGTLGLVRALRPLRRSRPNRRHPVVDEPATAARIAESDLWLPVLRPGRQPWLDLALVVDSGPSMVLWRRTAAELHRLLELLGAFRDIRLWRLDTAEETAPALYAAGSDTPRDPAELVDPAGRRLVLIVSDCIGPAWGGAMAPLLARWGAAGLAAVVQTLPRRMWRRCRPAFHRVRLHAHGPGVPNTRLRVEVPDGSLDPAGAGVAVPVVELDPRFLGPWAALASGTAAEPVPGFALFTGRLAAERPDEEPAAPAVPPTAEQRVRAFRSSVSPAAYTLATYLAAAPLTVPVMRLVQAAMLPDSQPAHLAEVFLGGLLRPRPDAGPGTDPHDEKVYDFHEGVRVVLLPSLHATEALEVVRRVSAYIAQRLGTPLDFRAVVASGEVARLRGLGRPFAEASALVLRSLGGAHVELAEQLLRPGEATGSAGPGGETDDGQERLEAAETEGDGAPGGAGTESAVEQDVHVRTPQQVRNAVPPRNSGFVGREAVLEEMARRLRSGPVVLLPDAQHSLGGTGKTQLALEYTHRHSGEYDLVWWVPAEQVAPMRAALAGLARALRVRESPDLNRTLQVLRVTLERGVPYRRWLLVFDNASRPEDIEPYLPRGTGHVLITSRNPRWADVGRVIEVGAFTRAESVLLLRRRSPSISSTQAHTLAVRLGDVPMAMEQAAATQNATGWAAGDYAERYDELRRDMGGTQQRPEYPSPIVVTWNLAYSELAERNPGAARLLDVCAFLAGEPVSWNVLWESRGAGLPAPLGSLVRVEKALRTALRELAQFGLAQVDPALSSVQVHRLGQLLLLERLEVADYPRFQQAAHDVLTAADPAKPDDPSSWPRYEELSAHLLYSDLLAGATDESRQLMLHYVRFLFVRGDYDSSRAVARNAFDRWRVALSDEHEDTLSAAYHLANALRAAGDKDEAAQLNQQTLATLRRVFGDDDESTLMTANSVGADLRLRGEFVAARNVDLDNLDRYRRLFGEAYPRTLRCANNLAVDMRLLGDFRQARIIDEQTLMHRRRVLPHPHPETLWSLISLAHNRFGLGEHEVAIEILTDALPAHADAFGEDHPGVLTGMRYLAMALRRAGSHARARKESEATMALWLEKYGDHSPDSLSAVLTYANCALAAGEQAVAHAAATRAVDGFTAVLGPRHPFTHAAEATLAAAVRASGDAGSAADLDRHALVGLARSVGAEHPFAVACAIGYASDLALAGQASGAVIASRDTVRVAQSAFGVQHPALLVASFNHALDLRAAHPAGEDRGAVSVAAEALRRRLGDAHPDTVAALAGRRLEFDLELPAT
ncbi:FxSxx-COOH system tetratricopeptide repeat protein [Dactylosporangium sp. CA-233914]|uniref:FxSxx-COOH system tetratricopeptide repeat protein n=1 Tax=Dactylosporangium sp. CA-233914 TaxID=3239934 RepID=UPI003D944D99